MSKVIRLETGECRTSSDLRQEKERVLLQNPSGFFDLYSFTKAAAAEKMSKVISLPEIANLHHCTQNNAPQPR
jgi:hypothetical protein